MPVISSTEHWIKPDALTINLNHFGDPDYLQVSVLAGAVVMAFKQDVIGYNAAHNYRTWPLEAANTYLETSSAYNVYARLTRSEVNARALIVYDTVLRDIEGREISYAENGSEVLDDASAEYFFIFLGQISGSVDSNGQSVQREWLIDFRFGSLDTSQYRNEESGGEWQKMFRLNKVTDMIDVLKKISSAVFQKIFIKDKEISNVKRSIDNDEDVPVNDQTIPTTRYIQTISDNKYLRKDKDDSTPFNLGVGKNLSVGGTLNVGSNATISGKTTSKDKITAEKGIQIGQNYVPGILTGSGGFFDENANGEVESLIIRRFLEVPELRYNRVQVTLGDKWNAAGAGVIERVSPDSDTTGIAWLKLEEGEFGAIAVGDICMGIFHSMNNADNASKDEEVYVKNDKGETVLAGFQFSGFYTCYFTITEITGSDNKEFRYELRQEKGKWEHKFHPSSSMHFVCYGSFSNPSRQTSVYTTRTYTRLLKNQNTWEIGSVNIAMQYGDLSNMSLHGLDMRGYSAYLNNIYMTGTIAQIKADGTPVLVANDRGDWKGGTPYAYYDRVSHNGSLWLCVNKDGTNTEPKDGDSSWLCQVKAGSSITSAGHWESKNTPYPANSIVTFADKVWISNKETSKPPFGTYTDKDGNRLTYNDGGYILVETLIQSEDWDLLLDAPQLTDGKDGESLQVRYSSDKSNWHVTFVEGDVWMQQRVGEGSVWSDAIRIVGESGSAGADGTYYDYQFAVNGSLDIAPTTGWQDTPPSVGIGQYLWMRTRLVNPNTSEENPWSVARIGGEKGEQGDSVSNMGAWKTGMAVPYLGIVTMGGKTFMSKVATNNPPMWTWTDKDGNRLIYKDGGYILTGELNTDEYDLVMQDGKDGRDGKDYEYIYIHSKTEDKPSKPTSEQKDDYIPTGWHDDPIGVTESLPYEWVCVRIKKDGIWSDYSTPALWAKFGKDGINGLQGIQGEKGEQGIQGEKGADGKTSYFHIKYADDANGTNMNESGGDYIGTYVDFVQSDSTDPKKYTWVKTKGAQGEKGDQGIAGTNGENGQTSYLHIAYANSADGKTGFSVSDSTGKLYIGQYTDFLLNDSTDPTKYKWTLIKGADGKDGEGFTMMGNWKTGMAVPKMGVVTMGGECFAAKVATTNPPLWTWTDKEGNRLIFSASEYILTGELNTSEYDRWSVKGEDGKDGADGQKGDKGDKGDTGEQGIQGCIIRDSEWVLGTQYRNDEALTSGTRYIDVVLVRNDSTATGWEAYKCKVTHTSTAATSPSNSAYWEKFGANITTIFTSLIIAKNAKINFLQGNQLLIQKNDGKVTAGLSGGDEGEKVRFWAGSETPDTAPYRVAEDGTLVATKAVVTGEVNATSGIFENVTISGVLRTPWKALTYKRIYSTATTDIYGYDGSAINDDKIEVSPVVTCEILIGWGANADGREVSIRVNNTSNSRVYITVPTGYFVIDIDGNKISEGEKFYLSVGYIYYLTGCKDCWIVNRRVSTVGNKVT